MFIRENTRNILQVFCVFSPYFEVAFKKYYRSRRLMSWRLMKDVQQDTISYPPCKKGIRPGICVKPVVSHSASGLVWYDWLHADTRPYPFFTRRITNLSSAPPPPPPPPHASQPRSQHTCIVDNGQISQWDLMGKINIMQSWDKKYVHLYTT